MIGVMVARTSGLTRSQIAEAIGIPEHSVQRRLKQAYIDDGVVEGTTLSEQDELVVLKRSNRVLEQEVEILRRATRYSPRTGPIRQPQPACHTHLTS